ncbi:hypothetical protein DY000_02037492 [Brassica cretica]|uniref:Anaphase-promoting complex subunit 4 WD40 domain-containing protein n=1 Tax=Brassica cretica TaxID=69181 RepID=A0ABQ7BCW6_BRACR|nr:hypothetical protein DY000_02037492 [Brassica cretica]
MNRIVFVTGRRKLPPHRFFLRHRRLDSPSYDPSSTHQLQGWSSVEVVSVIRSGGSGACLAVSVGLEDDPSLCYSGGGDNGLAVFFDIGSPEIDLAEETQVLAEESEWRTALPFGFFDVGSSETALVEETPVLPVCLNGGDLPSGFIADSAS